TDDALVLALKSNEIDIVPAFFGPVTKASLPSSIKRIVGPNLAALWFIVNQTDPKHPELNNPAVRKAFSYAINRKQIANLAYAGTAVPESSIVFTSAKQWHNAKLEPDPYAVAQANKILDGLGFARGADGIRVANGVKMSYEVVETSDVNAQA